VLPTSRPLLLAVLSLGTFAIAYGVFGVGLHIPEANMLAAKLRRRSGV
jgi:hypothetical protein